MKQEKTIPTLDWNCKYFIEDETNAGEAYSRCLLEEKDCSTCLYYEQYIPEVVDETRKNDTTQADYFSML